MFFIGPYLIDKPYILAPMAGISQMPFRTLAFEFGAGLAPTELISAKGLFYESLRTKLYLTFDPKIERPFSVQLFGGEIDSMAKAAELAVKAGAQIIDINMGCPVKKVTKTGAGSALLCDPKRAFDLVVAMRQSTGNAVPITVKIRSGWDEGQINCVEMAKRLEDAGVSAIALHPRTRAQGYAGKANWEHIAWVKKAVRIPVIGNGDVASTQCAERIRQKTGCDGVMIGRAALGNPWIFQQLNDPDSFKSPSGGEQLSVIRRHFLAHVDFQRAISYTINAQAHDEHCQVMAVRTFRSHLAWYAKGLYEAAQFRNQAMRTESVFETLELIESFFQNDRPKAPSCGTEDEHIDYRQAFG